MECFFAKEKRSKKTETLKDVQKQIKQMMKDYPIPKSSRNFAKKIWMSLI